MTFDANSPAPEPTTDATPSDAAATSPAETSNDLLTGASEQQQSDDKASEAEAPAGAPESYEAFTLDEGLTLEGDALQAVQALGKELNLPQEQAGKVASLAAQAAKSVADQVAAAAAEQKATWANDAKADKEFGGDKFNENLGVAKQALDAFGNKDFVKFLNDTGLSAHPEMIRTLWKIGQQIKPDNIETGEPATSKPKSDAEVFFGRGE